MASQYAGRPPRSEPPNLKCDGAEIGTAEERADILLFSKDVRKVAAITLSGSILTAHRCSTMILHRYPVFLLLASWLGACSISTIWEELV